MTASSASAAGVNQSLQKLSRGNCAASHPSARGVDARLARGAGARLVVFCSLAAANPRVFAVYWIALRASIGGAGYVFHHLLHNRGGALGTYALPLPGALVRAGRALFGEEPMLILSRHRRPTSGPPCASAICRRCRHRSNCPRDP